MDADIGEGLTIVTGVSGLGKTSLVFDALYHESRRRFPDIYALGSATQAGNARLAPADVESITGLGLRELLALSVDSAYALLPTQSCAGTTFAVVQVSINAIHKIPTAQALGLNSQYFFISRHQ